MRQLIVVAALLCTGCAETVIRAGNQCGVILNNGVTAWVPCATQNEAISK